METLGVQRRFSRLAVLGCLLLVLVLGTVLVAAWVNRQSVRVEETRLLPVQLAARTLSTAASDQETGERGYVITGDQAFLAPYTAGVKTAARAERVIQGALTDRQGADRIDSVSRQLSSWQNTARTEIAAVRDSGRPAAQALVEAGSSKREFDALRTSLTKLDALIDSRVAVQRARVHRVSTLLAVSVAVGAAMTLALGIAIWRSFRRWNRVRLVSQRAADARVASELRWNEGLVDLSAALVRSSTEEDTMIRDSSERMREMFGAQFVSIGLVDRFGTVEIHTDAELAGDNDIRPFLRLDETARTPSAHAIYTGRTVVVEDRAALAEQYPDVAAATGPHSIESMLVVPIQEASGGVLGSVALVYDYPIGADDSGLVSRARTAAEVVARNLVQARWTHGAETLARMSQSLGHASSDAEIATVVADSAWETVDGAFSNVAVAADDATMQVFSQAGQHVDVLKKYNTLAAADPLPLTDAIRTGTEIILRDLDDYRARYPGLVVDTMKLGLASTVSLPFEVHGKVVGGIGLGWSHSLRYDRALHARLDTLRELVAQAFERVRLTRAEHDLTTRISNRLAGALPQLDGLELAVRYQPAVSALGVGGDWYQVVERPDGSVAVVVGDVIGHGAEAAADMASIRTVIGTLLRMEIDLDEIFTRLEPLVEGIDRPPWGTALVASIDRSRAQMRVVSAGHLPPLIWRPGHGTETAAIDLQLPLGLGARSTAAPETPFPPGALLVGYTDGLVERRRESIDVGIEAVVGIVDRTAGQASCDEIADLLLQHASDSDHSDDIAVVVVRSTV